MEVWRSHWKSEMVFLMRYVRTRSFCAKRVLHISKIPVKTKSRGFCSKNSFSTLKRPKKKVGNFCYHARATICGHLMQGCAQAPPAWSRRARLLPPARSRLPVTPPARSRPAEASPGRPRRAFTSRTAVLRATASRTVTACTITSVMYAHDAHVYLIHEYGTCNNPLHGA